MMTEDELKSYSTVPEMAVIFRDDFIPKGFFYTLKEKTGTYVSNLDEKTWMWVLFEARAYKVMEDGKKQMFANGFSREEQGSSEFNKVNYHMTAQTRAIGRMFRNLGINVDKGMASREEIEASEAIIEKDRKAEQKKNAPKAKKPSMRANLKRLRVKFEEGKSEYTIAHYTHFSEKTMKILTRYGFQEVNDKLIALKEIDEA